jgi:hypothetical protein
VLVFGGFSVIFGGAGRNRTADKGFADPCLATWLPRPWLFSFLDALPYFSIQNDGLSNLFHRSLFLLALALQSQEGFALAPSIGKYLYSYARLFWLAEQDCGSAQHSAGPWTAPGLFSMRRIPSCISLLARNSPLQPY